MTPASSIFLPDRGLPFKGILRRSEDDLSIPQVQRQDNVAKHGSSEPRRLAHVKCRAKLHRDSPVFVRHRQPRIAVHVHEVVPAKQELTRRTLDHTKHNELVANVEVRVINRCVRDTSKANQMKEGSLRLEHGGRKECTRDCLDSNRWRVQRGFKHVHVLRVDKPMQQGGGTQGRRS
ncbi:hypothetical protein H257_04545 [Aphanomyces astaci]|uniref:Uncharacterized protein n=1 Tax=Aphanomyces astaci TaxID=112090 RepID=W4GUP8_APHAT|nr:hypothetical protein H257_04545 [Aphanomyces astaci]ETV82744.1 hypothetical protein H257_04545 [Aphanomyces astaci]|eukprot:XP_009827415.1 hypothetical protein H257_04545 [Aphanomyces astaci]